MSEEKWTPGPWKEEQVREYNQWSHYIIDSFKIMVAAIPKRQDEAERITPKIKSNPEVARANACLITASPDLLIACQMLLDEVPPVGDWVGFSESKQTAIVAAVAAIAKATGKEF